MRCRHTDLVSFWLMPWSAPFRDACVWVALLGAPLQGKQPDKDAPNWLRPLCVQRWVGQAVAARLAWLKDHPEQDGYRFGDESEPVWAEDVLAAYERRDLRAADEDALLRRFGVEVERLLGIAQEAPRLVGSGAWTCAALGASARIAQIYAELKRRHKAMRARALLREELRIFVTWQAPREETAASSASEPAAAALAGAVYHLVPAGG
jgi:hypothetical protein